MGKLIYVKQGEDRNKAYKLDENIGKKISKEKEDSKRKQYKEFDKAVSSKITYKKDNPLKGLLKIDRPTVNIKSKNRDRINLMRSTW
jgi:hypothetical protein